MSWSHSKLTTYEKCPSVKKFKYDLKVEVEKVPHPAAQRGVNMHKELEDHLSTHSKAATLSPPEWMLPHLPHLEKLRGGDKEVEICLDENWKVVAKEDRVLICVLDVLKPNEDGMHALVVDYKSGKRYPAHQGQLELYVVAALYAFPMLQTAEGAAYYLDEKPGSWGRPVHLARSNMEAVRQRWDDRVIMMEADTELAPRPGYYCRWCDYRKSEGGPCAFG